MQFEGEELPKLSRLELPEKILANFSLSNAEVITSKAWNRRGIDLNSAIHQKPWEQVCRRWETPLFY